MGLRVGRGLKVIEDPSAFHLLTEPELKRVQDLLLGITLDIAAFCEVFGLTVMLGGGSCLGAVRHKGFIPWDDDMDLNMPRADYEIFLREFPPLFEDKYRVQIPGVSKGCVSRTTQVRLKGTIARDFNDMDAVEPGLFVDVFPLENVPDNPLVRKLHGVASLMAVYAHSCRRYYQFRARYLAISDSASEDVQKAIRNKIRIGRLLAPASCETFARVMDRVNGACKNDNSEYVAFPLGSKFYFGEIVKREVHMPPSKGEFGGYVVNLPGDTDKYLSKLYGNYMKVPEESEREHHYFTEFDLGEYALPCREEEGN